MVKKILQNKVVILGVAAFLLTLLLGENWIFGINHVFTSSKENVSLALIENFSKTWNLTIPLEHHFSSNSLKIALTPRDAAQVNGSIIPQTFPAAIIIYGLVAMLSKYLIILVTPAIFSLIICFFYKIVRQMFSEKVAILSSVLLLLMPHFLYLGTSLISDDLFSLLFLLIGIDSFINKKLPLSTLAFGISILFRLPNAIWALPFAVIAISKLKDKKYFKNLYRFALSALFFFIPITAIALINFWLYGSPLRTGYNLQYPVINQIIGSSTRFFNGGILDFVRQISNYLVFLYTLPLFLAGIFLVRFAKKMPKNFLYAFYISCGIFLFLTWQYAGSIFWGHDQAALNSSFLRYTLPFYLFLPILTTLSIGQFKVKNQRIWLGVLSCSFIITLLFFRGGMLEKWRQLSDGQKIQQLIIESTSPDTLIISQNTDKYIYPKREVLISSLLRDKKAFGYTQISPWEAPLDNEDLANKLMQLHANNYSMLIIFNSTTKVDRINGKLASDNLRLAKQWQVNDSSAFTLESLHQETEI